MRNSLLHSRVKQEHTGRGEMIFELGLGEEGFSWMEAASKEASGSGTSWIPVLALLSPWLVTLTSPLSLGFPTSPLGAGCTCVSGRRVVGRRLYTEGHWSSTGTQTADT